MIRVASQLAVEHPCLAPNPSKGHINPSRRNGLGCPYSTDKAGHALKKVGMKVSSTVRPFKRASSPLYSTPHLGPLGRMRVLTLWHVSHPVVVLCQDV